MSYFVLLVEDNLDLSETVIQFLELEDIVCDYVSNAESALKLIQTNNYDVILLDIMLPRMNGLQLCQTLRNHGQDTPILMLTARDTLEDKLQGFESGTDDYIVKPFDLPELVARIKAHAKRKSGQSKLLNACDLQMDLDRHRATRNDRLLKPTPIGWKILEALIRKSPHPITRQELIRSIWGEDCPETNSLKVHMHKLRQQITKEGESEILHTIPNVGYAIKEQ